MIPILEVILIMALPFGTAILVGAFAERLGGKLFSGWVAFGGLVLGIYFLHKTLEIILAS